MFYNVVQLRTALVVTPSQPVGGDLAAAAVEDEIVGTVPGLDHVQAFMHLSLVTRMLGLAHFRLIGWGQ
jgi:hypothetical protein